METPLHCCHEVSLVGVDHLDVLPSDEANEYAPELGVLVAEPRSQGVQRLQQDDSRDHDGRVAVDKLGCRERPGWIVLCEVAEEDARTNPGLRIAWHGDDPGAAPISPHHDLASYVTRADRAEDGSPCEPPPWLADNALTAQEALPMMNLNSAYALGLDDRVGSLAQAWSRTSS